MENKILTNEEKALSIAESTVSERTSSLPANQIQKIIVRDACLKMADWKTQQAIERVTEFLNGCGGYWYVSTDSDGDAVLDRYSLLKDIIQVLKED